MYRKEKEINHKEYKQCCGNCMDCSHWAMDCNKPLATCNICKKRHHTCYHDEYMKFTLELKKVFSRIKDDENYKFLYKRNKFNKHNKLGCNFKQNNNNIKNTENFQKKNRIYKREDNNNYNFKDINNLDDKKFRQIRKKYSKKEKDKQDKKIEKILHGKRLKNREYNRNHDYNIDNIHKVDYIEEICLEEDEYECRIRELEEAYLSDDDMDYLTLMSSLEKENSIKRKMDMQTLSSQTFTEDRDMNVCIDFYDISNITSDSIIKYEQDILPFRSVADTLEPYNNLGNMIEQDIIILRANFIYETKIKNNNTDIIIKNISPELNISREKVLNNKDEDDIDRNHIIYNLKSILEEGVLNKFNEEEVILLQPSEKVLEFLELSLNKDIIIKNTIEGSHTLIVEENQKDSQDSIDNMNLIKSFTQENKNISITTSTFNLNNNIKTDNNIYDYDNANKKNFINIQDINRLVNAQTRKKNFNFSLSDEYTINKYFSDINKYDSILISSITRKLFKKPIRKVFDPGGISDMYF